MSKLAVVEDPLFERHVAPAAHPERPERLAAARRGLERSGQQLVRLAARDAELDDLHRVHTQDYVESLQALAGRSGVIDGDTFYCPDTWAAALRASGGLLALVDALKSGEYDYGFGLLRPPGHHATERQAMGFCLLNHVAVAARYALLRGASRVAIVDWDVHHGNGTEEIFYDDNRVLYVSLHQHPLYPLTGKHTALGVREGVGYNVNIPLSEGAGDAVYSHAFDRVVCPILSEFAPDLVLVSAGYDAHGRDPLGGMALSQAGFRQMTSAIARTLPDNARQRLAFCLEGGYDLRGIEEGVLGTCQGLVTEPEAFALPSEPWLSEIERAREALAPHWPL
jgi:acetoin utilization deacetylase AcuC-like enzyme